MDYEISDSTKQAEMDSITKFLARYWDVQLKPLTEIYQPVDYILDAGINYGIALQEKDHETTIRIYNDFVDMANRVGLKKLSKIDFIRTTSKDNFDFERETNLMEPAVKQWVISAVPKDYESFKQQHGSEDFADKDEALEFDGVKLPSKIAAGCFSFAECLKKGNIYYNEENQGRGPLTELVGAIFRQGMSIGMHAVEKNYGTEAEIIQRINIAC